LPEKNLRHAPAVPALPFTPRRRRGIFRAHVRPTAFSSRRVSLRRSPGRLCVVVALLVAGAWAGLTLRQETELVLRALPMALRHRRPPAGLL